MIKSNDFQKAIEFINKSNSILITTHSKPDGDACGSITALHEALTALGKKVKILLLSPLPKWYTFLFTEKVSILDQDIQPEEIMKGRFGKFDLVIVVDTNSYSQLPKFEQYLKQSDIPILVIDHHVTGDNLGTVELVDSKIAASALIVHDLFKYAKWPVTKNIAQALFLAVASDTGWFRFRNTDARVFQVCAELIKAGAKPEELYGKLNHNFSESRFRLMLRMLGRTSNKPVPLTKIPKTLSTKVNVFLRWKSSRFSSS
jgi:phosphoesterase RecJ-like protein